MTKEKNAPILSRLDLTSAFEKTFFVVLNFLLSIVVIQYLNYFFFIHNDRCIVNYQVSCIGFLRRYCFRTTSATCIGEVANSAYGESELVFSNKLVFTTPGSINMTFIPNSSNLYCIDSENPSKANLLLI